MQSKRKKAIRLIENIGLIVFGITNAIAGASLWSFLPVLAISLCILSPLWIIRGIAELIEIFSTQDKTQQK